MLTGLLRPADVQPAGPNGSGVGLAGLLLSGAFTALYAGACAAWQGRAGQARSGVRQDS